MNSDIGEVLPSLDQKHIFDHCLNKKYLNLTYTPKTPQKNSPKQLKKIPNRMAHIAAHGSVYQRVWQRIAAYGSVQQRITAKAAHGTV